MELIWKEHKRFILTVAGGAVVFLLYQSFLVSPMHADAEQTRQNRRFQENTLKALISRGVPEESALRRAQADRDHLKKTLEGLVQDLRFPLPEKYAPRSGDTKKEHFDNLRNDLYKELQQASLRKGLAVPERIDFTGLPETYDEALADELLLRLAVTERVWGLVIEHINQEQGGKIEAIQPMHGVENPDEPSARKRFLSRVSVELKFRADSRCVFAVLHGLQQRGNFLLVEHFDSERAGATKDEFKVELVVSAAVVKPGEALVATEE